MTPQLYGRMQAKAFYLGPWLVEPAAHRLSRGQESRRLSPKAITVLAILAAAKGAVVSRAELLEAAWPNVAVGDEVLTHAITELRRTLDDNWRRPQFVETVHKSGYRLLAEVKERGQATGHLIGGYGELSVAVLPFTNASGNQTFGGLVLLVTEEITDSLTAMSGVRVTCHETHRGTGQGLDNPAAAPDVDVQVEGRVVGAPGYARFAARLVDRRTETYLWSRSYDGLDDPGALSRNMASDISEAVRAHARGWSRSRSACGGINAESYVIHLRANELFYQGGRSNVHAACELFSQAAGLDPSFALPQAGLAKCLAFLHVYYEPAKSHLARAAGIAEATVRAHPQFAMAHATLGLVQSLFGDFESATDCFGSAIRLGSDAFEPHYLFGRVCFAEGRYAMAAALLERAAQLRNEDFHASILAAKAYRALGEFERAGRANQRAMHRLERYLGSYPGDLRAVCDKATCLVELGEVGQALDCASPISRSEDPMIYYLAGSYARAGQTASALDCLERILDGGWSHEAWLIHDRDFDSLRGEPRYQRIVRSLHLH